MLSAISSSPSRIDHTRVRTLTSRTMRLVAVAVAGTALLAACSSSNTNGKAGDSSKGGALVVGDLAPFTGADAQLGPIFLAGCFGATKLVNDNGGVLGHHMTCKNFDTRGEPADAVPAARQMFASTSNLALVIGATSDEASSVVPIINSNKMVVFSVTGQSEFDKSRFPYFYRLNPSDAAESYALVAIAHDHFHYSRAALAFGNDIGSQTFVQPAVNGLKRAGMTLTKNVTLNLQASSFRTEVEQILASHPDVIISEAFGPAAATFLSEIKQLNGGKMVPVILTSVDPNQFKAISGAIGVKDATQSLVGAGLQTAPPGPAYNTFKQAVLASVTQMADAPKELTFHGTPRMYDAVTLSALAMVAAKSTKPSNYAKLLKQIANGGPGATVVGSFADGVTALRAGKSIRYEGASGPIDFNQYNNSSPLYQADHFTTDGSTAVIETVPASLVAKYAGTGG